MKSAKIMSAFLGFILLLSACGISSYENINSPISQENEGKKSAKENRKNLLEKVHGRLREQLRASRDKTIERENQRNIERLADAASKPFILKVPFTSREKNQFAINFRMSGSIKNVDFIDRLYAFLLEVDPSQTEFEKLAQSATLKSYTLGGGFSENLPIQVKSLGQNAFQVQSSFVQNVGNMRTTGFEMVIRTHISVDIRYNLYTKQFSVHDDSHMVVTNKIKRENEPKSYTHWAHFAVEAYKTNFETFTQSIK